MTSRRVVDYSVLTPDPADPDTISALGRRLRTVAAFILGSPAGGAADSSHTATAELHSDIEALLARGNGVLADHLVRHIQRTKNNAELWLFLVGLTAAFPDSDVFLRCRRSLGVLSPAFALSGVLESVQLSFHHFDSLDFDLEVVTDRPVVDVDFCAKYDHNTGIQRVVRETLSRWAGEHPLALACWSPGGNSLRELSSIELRRVTDWDAWKQVAKADRPGEPPEHFHPRLLVPYRTVLLLPEVARDSYWAALSALAQFSGNKVGMIGYDTIPVASADLIAGIESEKFAKYLSIVKHADRVAAISDSAAAEFEGFAMAASAQGVPQTAVVSVPLAVQSPSRGGSASTGSHSASDTKLVLMVGNQEPRKNNLAVLFASETLWREGVAFRLRMIGGGKSKYTREVDRQVARLERAGHPVELLRGVGDDVLIDSYSAAYCTVFPSTHEGYGLPVAESLAMGVPSITTDYGSTEEIAAGGGCLTVDPRDDAQLVAALRRLLADPVLHDRLVAEARNRPVRDWNDYAAELWSDLVEPLHAAPPHLAPQHFAPQNGHTKPPEKTPENEIHD